MRVGIIYGSTTGNTDSAAQILKDSLQGLGEVETQDIADRGTGSLADYDLIVLGSSTWGDGEMQDDWEGLESLEGIDLTGKMVAVFGMGDQEEYSDTFVDAIGILAQSAEQRGARLIGAWPVEGYDFSESAAVRDGVFLGLALDDDNQADLTGERLEKWAEQLIREVG